MNHSKTVDFVPVMNHNHSVYVTTVFVLLIFGFFIATLLKTPDEKSETENRVLQQMPEISAESIFSGEFEEDYETYLSDQFIGRNKWITLKTGFERATLRQEADDVYFAKDDYLIEKHTGTFTSDTAKASISYLSQFTGRLSETMDAAHLTVMVVPNAVDILRDYLPAFADPYDEEDYLDQVRSALPEGVFFDTSSVLTAMKDEGKQVYYRTDHHWTTDAAFAVYSAWAKTKGIAEPSIDDYTVTDVTDSFEGTVASKLGITGRSDTIRRYDELEAVDYYLTYNQSDDVRASVYQESYLDQKDKYAYFYGGNFGLIEAKMPENATGRKLLIIKDSYAHCFTPFTYADFDQVDMLDPRYYNSSISKLMEEKQYTDVLFLFNASGFAEETSLARLLT